MTDKLPDKPWLPDKLPEPKELTDTDMAEVALENLLMSLDVDVEAFTEAAQILDFLGHDKEAVRLCAATWTHRLFERYARVR